MHLFSTVRGVLVKQSQQQSRFYGQIRVAQIVGHQRNQSHHHCLSRFSRNSFNSNNFISLRQYATTSVSGVNSTAIPTAIPLQLPPLQIQASGSTRSIGTLQPQQLKLKAEESDKESLSKSNSVNVSVYNLVSKDVIDYVSLKSLLEDNPEIRRFMCKVFEHNPNAMAVNHPFIQVAGNLFFQEDDFPTSLNTLGILVFLMGKLFETSWPIPSTSTYDGDSLISKKVMRLSRAINHSSAAFRIHRTIQETGTSQNSWNKLACLAGDLLVVNCIRNVASIGDNTLLLWTMNSLADFSSCEFQALQARPSTPLTFTPEGSLLSTGFRGVATLYGRSDIRLVGQMDRLGIVLGSLWMDEHKDEENLLIQVKESLEILSQFPDSEFTHFFKDFIYFWLRQK